MLEQRLLLYLLCYWVTDAIVHQIVDTDRGFRGAKHVMRLLQSRVCRCHREGCDWFVVRMERFQLSGRRADLLIGLNDRIE